MNIVVKVGTGVLTSDSGTLNEASMVHLATALASLMDEGHQVSLVSSGAVGAGVFLMGLDSYPSDLPTRQACAAVGQPRLMHVYEALFGHFGISVAQLLLTADDLKDRRENVQATLARLLENRRVLPIINENDTVSVRELRFGDNDILSVLVSELVGADRLFLLTGVDGLYPPGQDRKEIIPVVDSIDEVMGFAGDDKGRFSMGGMAAKLAAVKRAVESGIGTYIVNGRYPGRIADLLKGDGGKGMGTYFRERC